MQVLKVINCMQDGVFVWPHNLPLNQVGVVMASRNDLVKAFKDTGTGELNRWFIEFTVADEFTEFTDIIHSIIEPLDNKSYEDNEARSWKIMGRNIDSCWAVESALKEILRSKLSKVSF